MVSAEGGTGRRALLDALALLALLVVAFLVRLPGLGAPPLDAHHVRQSDTSSIARVMAREGIDVLRPRIGWAGPSAGTVESELPLYAAATAAGWRALGAEDGAVPAWPRALSVLAWLVGGLAVARIVTRRLPGVPLWAGLALYALSPLAVVFSRNVQPDALAIALLMLGLERADAAGSQEGRRGLLSLGLAAVLVGLAIASKGTLAFWLPLLPGLAARRDGLPRVAVAAATAVAVVLAGAWYAHAHLSLGADGASFKIWGAGSGKWGSPRSWFDVGTWQYIIGTGLSHTATHVGALLAALGAWEARREPELRPWLVGLMLGMVAIVFVTGGFALHNYYQLALVPFGSVLAGAGAMALWRATRAQAVPLRAAMIGFVVALAITSVYQGRLFVDQGRTLDQRIAVVAASVQAVLPHGVPTLVVDQHPQSLLYAIDQRGYHRQSVTREDVETFERWGAIALLITDRSATWEDEALLAELERTRALDAQGGGWKLFRIGVDEDSGPSADQGADAPEDPGL